MHRPTCLRYTNRPHAGPCTTAPRRRLSPLAAAFASLAGLSVRRYQEAEEQPAGLSESEAMDLIRTVRDVAGEDMAARLALVLGIDLSSTEDDNGAEDLAPAEQPLVGPVALGRVGMPAAKREATPRALFPIGQGQHPGQTISRRAKALRAQAVTRAYAAGRAAAQRTWAQDPAQVQAQGEELEAKLAALEVQAGIGPHPAEVLAYAASGLAVEALRLAGIYAASPGFVRQHSLESYLAAQLGEPPVRAGRPAAAKRSTATTGDVPEVAAYGASGQLEQARHMARVYAASPAFVRRTPLADYIAGQIGPA